MDETREAGPSAAKPAIDALAENLFPAGVVKMHGEPDMYRIRVGDYRIIYTVQSGELLVLVVRVGHRPLMSGGRT